MPAPSSRRRAVPGRAGTVAPAGRRPVLEAISVLLEPGPRRDPLQVARAMTSAAALDGWRLDPVTRDRTEIEIVPPHRRVRASRAWSLTRALRAHPAVVHAEPMFEYEVPENAPAPPARASSGTEADDPATDADYEWSLARGRVREAWELFGSREPGAGIIVAHPDTGYTPHPELAEPSRLLIGAGYDFAGRDADPRDELTEGRRDNPGHGTSTGSVIASAAGAGDGSEPFVSGVAPFASLVPIRVTTSVVLFSMRGLRQAIDHAVASGARVISISLGGPLPGFGLQRAFARAAAANVIPVAAAGNEVEFVVFPAAFDDVVAAAASNVRDLPWRESSHGRAVDITAPGESVWRARVVRGTGGRPLYDVARGTGTSYAAAAVAGAAALWLSYRGAEALARRYGPGGVPRVFLQLLVSSARVPKGWNTREYGAGILDARRLLEHPLPDAAPARKLLARPRALSSDAPGGIDGFAHVVSSAARGRIEETLARLFDESDRELPDRLDAFGSELLFHLVMNPPLLASFRRACDAPTARASAAGLRHTLARLDLSPALRRAIG